MSHLIKIFLTVCLVTQVPSSRATMIRIDGHAQMEILVLIDNTIVIGKTVSGTEGEELIALDTRSGAVKWRRTTYRVLSRGTKDAQGAFFLITKDFLEKRTLGNGSLVWRAQLDSIAQQQTVQKKKFKDLYGEALEKLHLKPVSPKPVSITMGLGGTPNSYYYQEPVISGDQVLVAREAVSGGGCVVMRCFDDWLLFNQKSGKLTAGGSGGILGRSSASVFFGDAMIVRAVSNGRLQDLETSLPNGLQSYGFSFTSGYRLNQLSSRSRCISEHRGTSGTELLLVEDGRSDVRSIPVVQRDDCQSGWILLDQYIVRYAECMRYSSDPVPAPVKMANPWVELYDLKGVRRSFGTLPQPKGRDSWWISCVGKTDTNAWLKLDQTLLRLDIPSLNVVTEPTLPHAGFDFLQTTREEARAGGITCRVLGNTNLHQMNGETQPHDFKVTAEDTASRRLLWNHTERVIIRKAR